MLGLVYMTVRFNALESDIAVRFKILEFVRTVKSKRFKLFFKKNNMVPSAIQYNN